MISTNTEIERSKKRFFIQRIHKELDTLEEGTSRYDFLNHILTNMNIINNDLDTVITKDKCDVCTKKWNKIPDYYKKQKIMEYMNEKYETDPKRKDIETMLIQKVESGELNTCKIVTYNTEEMKITKIMLSKKEIY
jgi:hypothetical protein